jgi:GGDEF domain-containing protein
MRSGGYGSNRSLSVRGAPAPDSTCLFGLPAEGLSPEVRAALTAAMADIHRLRQERDRVVERETRLRLQAEEDPVVALLPNRRALLRRLHGLHEHARRERADHTFAVVTLVGGSALRLCCGARAVEAAMTRAAGAIAGELRGSDVVGSLGGFDIGVVLTLTAGVAAVRKIDAMVARATAAVAEDLPSSVPARLAWGAGLVRRAESVTELLDVADRDLRRRFFVRSDG